MNTVYAAYEDALLVVDDATGDPSATIRLDGYRPECVAAAGDIFVGTFESGLLRSTDSGNQWERLEGIDEDAVMSLAFASDDPGTIYAGTEPSAVYRSRDGGDRWERLEGLTDLPSSENWSFPPRPHTHHVRWIEPAPNDPSLLYVGIEAGALVRGHLDEDGVTWEDRVEGSRVDTHTITTHKDRPGHAWVAAGDGYAETIDFGDTWCHPQTDLEHSYCWSVAVDNAEPRRVIISAASGAGNAHRSPGEAYLYRKQGERWERLDDVAVPTGKGALRSVLRRGTDAGDFWAANNHGLYRTESGGDSWDEVGIDWPERFTDQTCRGLWVVD
ncbi:MAG: hypothetical protein V5A38_05805 [Halolamina sp.]|uniref:hypothetical protein n=1 Tax=Halolamina sp. TaxID=1940283 RepID=UPI002FC39CBF